MNYELAKQLKDAGFEHNICCESCKYPDICEGIYLEELITAVAHDSFILGRQRNKGPNNYGDWDAQVYTSATRTFCVGSTPTEAVARLWLALNKSG